MAETGTTIYTQFTPKLGFGWRKLMAWALIGPLNPVTVGLMIAESAEPFYFGAAGFLLWWPSILGAAIGLWRLPSNAIREGEFTQHTIVWAFMTIPIYTLSLSLVFGVGEVVGQEVPAASAEILRAAISGVVMMPFAMVIGFPAALYGTLFGYVFGRLILYDVSVTRPSGELV